MMPPNEDMKLKEAPTDHFKGTSGLHDRFHIELMKERPRQSSQGSGCRERSAGTSKKSAPLLHPDPFIAKKNLSPLLAL